jgi:hypothetical protein
VIATIFNLSRKTSEKNSQEEILQQLESNFFGIDWLKLISGCKKFEALHLEKTALDKSNNFFCIFFPKCQESDKKREAIKKFKSTLKGIVRVFRTNDINSQEQLALIMETHRNEFKEIFVKNFPEARLNFLPGAELEKFNLVNQAIKTSEKTENKVKAEYVD